MTNKREAAKLAAEEQEAQQQEATEQATAQALAPAEYAPPQSAQAEPVEVELEGGSILVSLIRDGERYAATGATAKDARALLEESPEMCRVRHY